MMINKFTYSVKIMKIYGEKFGAASLNNGQSRFLKIFTKKKFKLGLLKIWRYRIYINPFLM